MKKFFGEFKKFITRGNVMDMAVGVIVGGAFTAIVNGLSNFVLKPIINWILALILGKGSLSEVYTFLGTPTYLEDGTIDLANSFYIDWGSLINAIINFLIIAFVLFAIVKFINRVKDGNTKLKKSLKGKLSKEEKKELKSKGIKLSDKKAVEAYMEEKAKLQKEAEAKAKLEAEAKAKAEREANPTTEDLLKQIRDLLKKDA
ncbi:MAG: large conductance mechanosensitive channel protein MscL [Clostridia bacterium]|nr:large conductance mechanosensitive channel protein MscL [Clostridia bacterium]